MKKKQIHEVVDVKLLHGYVVECVFDDLTQGAVDLKPFLGRGIFRDLLDKRKFKQLRVDAELGTLCWPNGADVAPETLYQLAKK